jgi:hypothetical protein
MGSNPPGTKIAPARNCRPPPVPARIGPDNRAPPRATDAPSAPIGCPKLWIRKIVSPRRSPAAITPKMELPPLPQMTRQRLEVAV